MTDRTQTTNRIVAVAGMAAGISLLATSAAAAPIAAPSSSLLANMARRPVVAVEGREPHALLDMSLFAISPPELRIFEMHDLIEIIVRESSRAESSQELETEKDWRLRGAIEAWPNFQLEDLLNLQIYGGRTTDLPVLDILGSKDFSGEGDYLREDGFTARLSAEVIDILPNGNLILEARTQLKMDEEETTMRVTGVCRPIDVSAANTVLSSQVHDLKIEKANAGEVRKSAQKGILAKILDTIFAF